MADSVVISYPEGGSVPGGGGLFAWGRVTGVLSPDTAQASLQPNEGNIASVDPPSPSTWAFSIGGLKVGKTYTLTVCADDMDGGKPVCEDVTFTVGGK